MEFSPGVVEPCKLLAVALVGRFPARAAGAMVASRADGAARQIGGMRGGLLAFPRWSKGDTKPAAMPFKNSRSNRSMPISSAKLACPGDSVNSQPGSNQNRPLCGGQKNAGNVTEPKPL